MSDLSARLNMPYLQPAQAQKHVTHNTALTRLDYLVQLVLQDTQAETPPDTPQIGATYGLGTAPTGEWAGQGGMIAAYEAGAWMFITPDLGWRAWDLAQDGLVLWDGSGWRTAEQSQRDTLGIGTLADAQTPLAVSGASSLFSHAGTSHQVKVNKAASDDTASLLFQSGFTGHAEIGLVADLGLVVKVSGDGSTWHEALKIEPNTGHISGTAVQASATDTTAGRLMRADYGYGPGNLVGAVSQSAGQPTGAVFERGSDSNGAWLRYGDGTQLVWGLRSAGSTWTFPQSFVSAPVVTVTATQASPRMVAVTGTTTTIATPRSYDSAGGEQVGEDLSCFAVGRWF